MRIGIREQLAVVVLLTAFVPLAVLAIATWVFELRSPLDNCANMLQDQQPQFRGRYHIAIAIPHRELEGCPNCLRPSFDTVNMFDNNDQDSYPKRTQEVLCRQYNYRQFRVREHFPISMISKSGGKI
jgi:hypothetical protein